MKLEELLENFRAIVREEVTKAVQSELRGILTEAVDIASRPDSSKDNYEPESLLTPVQQKYPVPSSNEGNYGGLGAMFEDTRRNMTGEDYTALLGESTNATPGNGLPPFTVKAKKILDAVMAKDREKHAVQG